MSHKLPHHLSAVPVFHPGWLRRLSASVAGRNTLVVLCAVVVSACGGTISSDDDLARALSLKVEVVQGEDQVTAPKTTWPLPVEFKVTDTKGSEVSGAEIQFRLIEVTGTEPTIEDLLNAWDSDLIRLRDLQPAQEQIVERQEDVVGRVITPPRRTDQNGRAAVQLDAPTEFSRTIALVVRVVGEFGRGAGFALLKTGDVSAGNQMLVLSSTNQMSEVSGRPFDIWIMVRDRDERYLERNFAHQLHFRLTYSMEGADLENSLMPPEEFSCEFSGGRCKVPPPVGASYS